MSVIKVLSVRIVMVFIVLCIAGKALAQESEIDTSMYLPYHILGALHYNLMIASASGYPSEIDRLISKGADINTETDERATPLILAAANNRISAVEALLDYKPELNVITSRYETPLLIAVKNGYIEVAEMLIRAGADIDLADNNGATPLHYAAIYGYIYTTDMLLYYEASVDKKSLDGTTPLMSAIWAGHGDVADLLIQNNANMEARDNDGFTPLIIAAQNADTLIMDLLISKGVDIYELNNYGYDALAVSIKTNQNNAVLFLLKKGLDWKSRKIEAVNPYYVAAKYRRPEVATLLKNNNFPGELKPGFDQIEISISSRFNANDIFEGLSLSFREPLINGGISAGFDTKLWYTRVMLEESENVIFQYREKRSIVYLGLFKDFALTDNQLRGNFYVSASLSLGYTFGNKYRGTNTRPVDKFMIIPSTILKWQKKNIGLIAGLDYMRTGYYNNSPLWGKAGFSYFFFFDKVRAPVKSIKWY